MFRSWIVRVEKRNVLFVIFSACALILSLSGCLQHLLPFDIAWLAILLCGIPIIIGAAQALILFHDIKADVLVSIALIASICIGQYFAAGEVALIMAIGTLLEDATAHITQKSIKKLIQLVPQTAHIRKNGQEEQVPISTIRPGDTLVILSGETIPVDGILLSKQATLDQAAMTGESLPMNMIAGDTLMSGTINAANPFEIQATKIDKDSALQRIVHLAKKVGTNKAPIVKSADKLATWAVWIALAIAVITGIITQNWIRAVTVLVVFCPCAFVLATPTAIMAGIGNASRKGILIRSGESLERFSKISMIAFDKTGTLTTGKLSVSIIQSIDKTLTRDKLLSLAASVEAYSEHPLGKAIYATAKAQQIPLLKIQRFQNDVGAGVHAFVSNQEVFIGNLQFLHANHIPCEETDLSDVMRYNRAGAIIVYIAIEHRLVGYIVLSDTLRPEAKTALTQLKNMGIHPILLTGDRRAVAEHVAEHLEIRDIFAELMPEDKMKIIKQLEVKEHLCMIGDGINDTLALRSAFAGVSMGNIGSDIAVESSDAVLVHDSLENIPALFALSTTAIKKIRQNILFSMLWNLLAILFSVTGLLVPTTGALMHNFGSVAVVINSALLFFNNKPINSESQTPNSLFSKT